MTLNSQEAKMQPLEKMICREVSDLFRELARALDGEKPYGIDYMTTLGGAEAVRGAVAFVPGAVGGKDVLRDALNGVAESLR